MFCMKPNHAKVKQDDSLPMFVIQLLARYMYNTCPIWHNHCLTQLSACPSLQVVYSSLGSRTQTLTKTSLSKDLSPTERVTSIRFAPWILPSNSNSTPFKSTSLGENSANEPSFLRHTIQRELNVISELGVLLSQRDTWS